MKINKKTFINTIKTLLIVLAFTFSTNSSASTASTSLISTNISATTATNVLTISGNTHALTWRWWRWRPRKRYPKRTYPNPKPTPSVPLDGGLSILLAGAAFFGIRKLRSKNNDKI